MQDGEKPGMSHNETIAIIKKMITDYKTQNEEKKKLGP